MFNKLKEFFSPEKTQQKGVSGDIDENVLPSTAKGVEAEVYNVSYVHRSEASNHPNLFDDLVEKNIEGMVIQSFVEPEVAKQIVENAERQEKHKMDYPFGSVIGRPTVDYKVDGGAGNIKLNQEVDQAMDDLLTFNFADDLAKFIGAISERYKADKFYKDGESFLIGTLRLFNPDGGGLMAHTGNEFAQRNAEKGMADHFKDLEIIDGYSFFILLQPPEEGGELVLFDLLWENTPDGISGDYTPLENDTRMDPYDFQTLKMGAGDLLMFRGGDIWHRVNAIGGKNKRVTFGGFFAKSKTTNTVHFWS